MYKGEDMNKDYLTPVLLTIDEFDPTDPGGGGGDDGNGSSHGHEGVVSVTTDD